MKYIILILTLLFSGFQTMTMQHGEESSFNKHLLTLVINDSLKSMPSTIGTIISDYIFDEELDQIFTFFKQVDLELQKKMINIIRILLEGFFHNYNNLVNEFKYCPIKLLKNKCLFFFSYVDKKKKSMEKYYEIKFLYSTTLEKIQKLRDTLDSKIKPFSNLSLIENEMRNQLIAMTETPILNKLKYDLNSLIELYTLFYTYLDDRYSYGGKQTIFRPSVEEMINRSKLY